MSSRGKRSSILKKQQALPSTNGRASPVASLSSAFKSSRKIEFNRKKSVKEFLVGEDVDTIWGNSYEVSTDGTPSSGLDDATLANSTSPSITVDEQDKENRSLNQPAPVGDDSLRRSSINGTNTSWDLSITIADDERRRIRNETSAVFSQSLNTTERLLVEPVAVTRAPANVRIKLNGLQVSDDTEVQAMDISPLKPNVQPSPSKSPRKMIYTFPKQAMFVEINDVPGMSVDGAQSAHQQRDEQKTPSIRPSWRTTTSGTGSQMHRSSYSDVSETWNSHPHAVFHQRMLAQTRDGGDMANVSSDVDTTIALTNAMTKVLQSCTNESIQQAANMELDESTTTTIPTNALARARPSFLPSNQRPSVDESQCLDVGADRTPISIRQPEKETLPADISSPLEGHTQRNSLSFDNLSLLNDMKLKEADTHKRDTLEQQEQIEVEKCSVEEGKREVFKIDFGLSSLSMNGRPSSPEMPVVVKPRILRPTLPPGMLLEIAKSEMKQTDSKDESDRTRMTFSRQQAIECSEDPDRAEDGGKKSLVPMDISTSGEHHTIGKPSIASIHSRLTVDMVESPKQPRQTGRSTVFTSHDIELEDRVELPGKHRGTVLSDEKMELTAHVAATTPRPADSGQQELILDETTGRLIKRATVLGTVPIDESFTDCFSPHSPQTALNNYRKTVYPLERMKEDVRKVPDRQTIVCNDSMALDVCATPTQAKTGAGSSSISCVVYGRHVDELSIHATRGNNAMDVTFARSATVASDCRQTLLQQENMAITEATVSNRTLVTRSERLTTHAVRAMEEDESTVDSCAKKGSNTTTRKSNFNPEAMELTTVEKATEIILERSGEVRHTMHATEVMDESRVEPALCVRMDTIGHAELQACVDLHQTHQIEEMMAPVEKSVHQQSRIPRLTSHRQEDMVEKLDKPRYSIYERADMDVTNIGDRSHLALAEKEPTVHRKCQQRTRLSVYEHEAMNATNVCNYSSLGQKSIRNDGEEAVQPITNTHAKSVIIDEKELKPIPRQTTHPKEPLDIEAPNDITNYNTFLEHYESSHATSIAHPMDLCQEKAFNSTRLSKTCERDDDHDAGSVIRSRLSSYRVEPMDETGTTSNQITTPDQICPANLPEKTPFCNAQLDSPMHMSPVGDVSRKSAQERNARKTVYYPEEMKGTPNGKSSKTSLESFGLRRSDLQKIAKQSDPIDMEGISVLESDATDPKLEKHIIGATTTTRGTIFFNDRGTVEACIRKQPNNHRLSIYDAAAMIEETVPIDYARLKQGQSSRLMNAADRKSNDLMDETIVPENIRVERDVKYSRQSFSSMGSTGKESPIVCPAEHPPAIDDRLLHEQGTPLCGTEDMMELTTALPKTDKPLQTVRSRQTIHRPASMDLTLVGRATVTPPPLPVTQEACSYRETIRKSDLPTAQEVVKSAHRRTARQTILISQDMDVEDQEEEQEEHQQSYALSTLPRETTEDCVPRSASILPKRTFSTISALDICSEFTKPSHPDNGLDMCRQLSQTSERKTVTRNDTRAFNVQDLSDISMSTSTMQPEIAVPYIGNITGGMMSMHEIPESLPSASFQSNSVSVICRVQDAQEEPVGLQTMAFIPTRPYTGASDDEYYDAEEGEEAAVDPLSLTKSRHLTMKFIDVGQLEQTGYGTVAPVLAPASKRVHAQVISSPFVSRPPEEDQVDPLQMTNLRQSLPIDVEHTPQGPIKKRARTSFDNQAQEDITSSSKNGAAVVNDSSPTLKTEPPAVIEEVLIKQERQTLANAPARETLIHDPSVFVMEEQNLLDDESDLPCTSLTEDMHPDENEDPPFSDKQSLTPPPSSSLSRPPSVCKLTELSYYKNFANLTIDTFDSGNEEASLTPDDMSESAHQEQQAFVAECISVSDEDSLIVTPPRVPLACPTRGGGILDGILNARTARNEEEVLESTIASEIMYQIRQKHPIVKHPCCGMQTECLCRLRRELKRHQEVTDAVWNRWCSKYETIKQRIPKVSEQQQQQQQERSEEKPRLTIEEQIEELNWRLLRGKLNESFLFVQDELSREDVSRRRSRTAASGHYPETPSLVFLAENLRSYLSEESYVDCSPPPGAPMPRIPRITQLIANKLSTDPNTRWLLDCSEECDGLLLLRHRILRSFVISLQLAPPRTKNVQQVGSITENWRLERIQVRECQQEYVHSPKLLLAHIEFMRLAKETTERTLRSTYRTVAALMGLWHRFDELLQRVFDAVNRLLTIIRNNEALLCYDAQMERFCVKKCFHRTLDDGQIEANILLVNFSWIGSIAASGVSFKWPIADTGKLIPAAHQQHSIAPGSNCVMQGIGTNDKAGLMFLECLLWNVAKQYES